jgi:hypothetical protein
MKDHRLIIIRNALNLADATGSRKLFSFLIPFDVRWFLNPAYPA